MLVYTCYVRNKPVYTHMEEQRALRHPQALSPGIGVSLFLGNRKGAGLRGILRLHLLFPSAGTGIVPEMRVHFRKEGTGPLWGRPAGRELPWNVGNIPVLKVPVGPFRTHLIIMPIWCKSQYRFVKIMKYFAKQTLRPENRREKRDRAVIRDNFCHGGQEEFFSGAETGL